MRRFAEPEKKVRSEVRENLESRCANCSHCQGHGLVTIYHDKYQGEPYIRLKRRDGKRKAYALRVDVPCVCPLGFWIKTARDPEDATAHRYSTIDFQKVIEGCVPWSVRDPTLPRYDPGQLVEPGDFAAMLERASRTMTHVRQVNREHRRREEENWLVRFLVNALESGPKPFLEVIKRACEAGHGNERSLRTAAELTRIKITTVEHLETWSLE
jgi:hypothetical protein